MAGSDRGLYLQAGSCRDKATMWLLEQGEAARPGAPSMLPEPGQHQFTSASASASAPTSASPSLGRKIQSPPPPGPLNQILRVATLDL